MQQRLFWVCNQVSKKTQSKIHSCSCPTSMRIHLDMTQLLQNETAIHIKLKRSASRTACQSSLEGRTRRHHDSCPGMRRGGAAARLVRNQPHLLFLPHSPRLPQHRPELVELHRVPYARHNPPPQRDPHRRARRPLCASALPSLPINAFSGRVVHRAVALTRPWRVGVRGFLGS